mmetsp:Transcript_31420/g.108650  ORF Transcript_31420/g.108650 Transcript_31420/m.108650 type:complete len:280 (-) Transcript_31420:18-857(-)
MRNFEEEGSMVLISILQPLPMEDEIEAERKNLPGAFSGLAAWMACISARRLSTIFSAPKETRPSGAWMRPFFGSVLTKTRPRLNAAITFVNSSGVSATVPGFLGPGMRPRGPRTRAAFLRAESIFFVQTAASKSISPPTTASIKSCPPMTSAPASFAAAKPSASSSSTKTANFFVLPVPCGYSTTDFTDWSGLRGSSETTMSKSMPSSKRRDLYLRVVEFVAPWITCSMASRMFGRMILTLASFFTPRLRYAGCAKGRLAWPAKARRDRAAWSMVAPAD